MEPSYVYKARIDNVVDGDTVDLYVDKGFRDYKKDRFRLVDIDTPERGQEGYQQAKDFVSAYLGEWVVIRSFPSHEKDQGSFGRWLVEIFVDDGLNSLNELLLSEGLAKKYK